MLNEEIISGDNAMLFKDIVQIVDGLVKEETAYLCAFRIITKY